MACLDNIEIILKIYWKKKKKKRKERGIIAEVADNKEIKKVCSSKSGFPKLYNTSRNSDLWCCLTGWVA